MPDIAVPHLRVPLALRNGDLDVIEQDSYEEIEQCVQAILRTVPGERESLPDFGLPDQLFRQGGVDLEQVRDVVERWEPRADVALERHPGLLELLTDHIRMRVTTDG